MPLKCNMMNDNNKCIFSNLYARKESEAVFIYFIYINNDMYYLRNSFLFIVITNMNMK